VSARRGRDGARILRRAALLLAIPAAGWLGGLVWFAETIPSAAADDGRATDAIVVLTGGAARLKAGLDLLAAGRARKLFVSGVYRGVDVAELLRVGRQDPERLACCVVLGHEAESTAGNADETRAWMAREGFTSLRLVTASYHMRRSLIEFRRAMPAATILPHAVAPDGFRRERWWAWPGTLRLVVSEYNKTVGALARAWVAAATERAAP
jgi:uncharacterized SAM-binding protein YcdF (DUF218 family)